ncbi:MAG: ABC transporter permease [Pseudohongiellaceae bacterium]|jgi:putative ABC transport system permease protein
MFAMLPVNLKLAVRSLNRNRLRTLLTMLGIIIGVAAVLTMVALGTGARASVEGEVGSAGTNIIFVRSGNYTRGGDAVGIVSGRGAATTLVAGDVDAIRAGVSGIKALSPGVSLRTFIASGSSRAFTRVQGIDAGFADIYSWNLSAGRMLDSAAAAPEAVLGASLAATLFGADADPLGQMIQVRDSAYRVVGVSDGQAEDHAEVLFVPWQTLQKSLGQSHLDTITIAAEKAGESSRIASEITTLLRERHGITGTPSAGYLAGQGGVGGVPDDFTVETQAAQALTKGLYTPAAAFALANLPKLDEVTLEEMADTLDRASDTMTALLASIAGVSLIVGGIGIMNIMLVSITERTREIGLRMAAGARSGDVALQFLIEAVTLSMAGGLVGLVLGLVSAQLIGWSLGWPTTVSLGAMALAIGIAASVGLVFGSYPARRAAQLDPIEALRTE